MRHETRICSRFARPPKGYRGRTLWSVSHPELNFVGTAPCNFDKFSVKHLRFLIHLLVQALKDVTNYGSVFRKAAGASPLTAILAIRAWRSLLPHDFAHKPVHGSNFTFDFTAAEDSCSMDIQGSQTDPGTQAYADLSDKALRNNVLADFLQEI